jgi:hypothetical protein
MKPLGSNYPSSDKVYQGMVIIPYVKGTYEKFRCTGKHMNVRSIFKIKHTFYEAADEAMCLWYPIRQ